MLVFSVRDEEVIRITHKYRPLLCHLNLQGCAQLSSDGLKAIGYCRNLQDLNLSQTDGLNVGSISQSVAWLEVG